MAFACFSSIEKYGGTLARCADFLISGLIEFFRYKCFAVDNLATEHHLFFALAVLRVKGMG